MCAGEREEQRRSRGGAAGESAAFNLGEIQESDLHNDVTFAKTDLWYVHRAGGRCREDITISRIMGFDSQQRAEEEQRRSRGGAGEEQGRSRGGAEEEQGRSRGGAEEEQRG